MILPTNQTAFRNRTVGIRVAFTLVEILTVLAIISIMGGMVLAAVSGVTRSAREARSKTIVAAVDSVIQERYQSLRFRAFDVEVPNLFLDAATQTNAEIGYEVLASEAARVRLNMLRDLMRMELPDRYTDITSTPSADAISIFAACSLVKVDSNSASSTFGQIIDQRSDLASRKAFGTNWNGTTPSSLVNYRSRVRKAIANSSLATISQSHQSAECLYMIMSTTFTGGTSAIDSIPSSNIGDLDEDGMPEILDGWGRPLGFVRWPVGYSEVDDSIDKNIADEFDLFRSDFAYVTGTANLSTTAAPSAVDVQTGRSDAIPASGSNPAIPNLKPWSMRPLVLSAGDDGEFGISLDPIDASGAVLNQFEYYSTSWMWPINTANMGDEAAGRGTGTYLFIDPYLRQFIRQNDPTIVNRSAGAAAYTTSRRLPGEDLDPMDDHDSTAIRDTRRDDNITNYDLQAAE